jgi:hypothetical protein
MRALPPVLLAGLLAFGLAACSEPVPCGDLCARARQCEPEVIAALVERLPRQSEAFKHARAAYPDRVGRRAVAACSERCTLLGRSRFARETLGSCRASQSCADFARCAAPFLEP